jgi:propanediol dehydratase small subunit
MSTLAYALTPSDLLLTHDVDTDLLLHDLARDDETLRVQALVASGDYFETLAAELEQVAAALPVHCVEQYKLQDYITQLLYLQRTYTITRKP